MNKRCALMLVFTVFSLLALQGCAGKKSGQLQPSATSTASSAENEENFAEPHPDSVEKMNRGIFAFNDGFITYVFSPIDTVYTGFFPPDVRNGFGNFYRNLEYPERLLNALLQFKFDKIAKETASFALNTVFGVGGLFNITRNMPSLHASPEDFGQTLAFYGLGNGSYLVLPFIGPSSFRDAFGMVADSFLSPVSWLQPDSAKYAVMGHDKANAASASLPAYKTIKAESFDHYTSMKDAYFQYRGSLEKE